ncbi:hypothetical protein HY214_03430 [Candidatus Roizmanbacteria bacterium]|nr:hypothetical protein [Candidatus Roizmanbacteria bacterium]
MWIERLADYGIPLEEATQITNDAYARINQALLRKAKLVNPSANIINVNFDEVPLHQAIEEWMTNLGIQYDPTKRITEVIQTYVGPHQLELLKQALLRRLQSDHLTSEECFKVVDLLAGNVHLRMKQMDHLRWGSMNLPKEVITGRREPTREELEQMESDYMFSLGVKLMNDVYHRLSYPNAPLAAVGFADLPGYGNAVQHESRDAGFIFVGRPGEQRFLDSIKNQLTHPARLHRGNVKEHLDFIKAYTNDTTATKKTLVSEKSALLNVTSPVTKKMMRRIAN